MTFLVRVVGFTGAQNWGRFGSIKPHLAMVDKHTGLLKYRLDEPSFGNRVRTIETVTYLGFRIETEAMEYCRR